MGHVVGDGAEHEALKPTEASGAEHDQVGRLRGIEDGAGGAAPHQDAAVYPASNVRPSPACPGGV